MTRIAITDVYVPPEIDLWGDVFVLRPMTKAIEAKAAVLAETVEEKLANAKDGAEAVAVVGELLDLQLKRLEVNGNGKQSKPSTILKQKWASSELSVPQLRNFFVAIGEANDEARPI